MGNKRSFTILISITGFLSLLMGNAEALRLPENVTIPALFTFGDSIVDTGNNNYIETTVKSNFAPYGRNFLQRQPTGRFCNGKVPSDLLVEALGIKELLPAFLDPSLQISDLHTGVNFASGGAGYDRLTSDIMSVISLPDQLKLFKEYTEQLSEAVGEAKAKGIVHNSLFLVVAGTDDLANTYFSFGVRRSQYDIPSYIDLLIVSASNFFQEMYTMGVRRIGVSGVPPVGCLPSQRTLAGGMGRKCAQDHNKAAELFNTKLSELIGLLNSRLPGIKIAYADIYNPVLNFIQNPQSSGFEVVNRGYCGTGLLEVAFLCNPLDAFNCKDVSKYVFWDSYHPTEKAYKLVAQDLFQKLMDDIFCSGRPC